MVGLADHGGQTSPPLMVGTADHGGQTSPPLMVGIADCGGQTPGKDPGMQAVTPGQVLAALRDSRQVACAG